MSEHEGAHAGVVAGEGVAQVVPGAEAPQPGQPPTGLPNGPGVDQWGRHIQYASEDPSERTGAQDEAPPGDPASTPAGAPATEE